MIWLTNSWLSSGGIFVKRLVISKEINLPLSGISTFLILFIKSSEFLIEFLGMNLVFSLNILFKCLASFVVDEFV